MTQLDYLQSVSHSEVVAITQREGTLAHNLAYVTLQAQVS